MELLELIEHMEFVKHLELINLNNHYDREIRIRIKVKRVRFFVHLHNFYFET
jgi:hypothetical protein